MYISLSLKARRGYLRLHRMQASSDYKFRTLCEEEHGGGFFSINPKKRAEGKRWPVKYADALKLATKDDIKSIARELLKRRKIKIPKA
jgi:hypothetical protein